MDNLKQFSDEEICKMIENKEIAAKDLTDSGICPTCFDKKHNGILYGDNSSKMLYEDEEFECFLAGNPRAKGHVIISPKKHFKDMLEIDPETNRKTFLIAEEFMIAIKQVYASESVYLCTMSDGPMNHFHVQLIPRYSNEERGSKNFVKQRQEYVDEPEKVEKIRKLIRVRLFDKKICQ